LPAVAQAAARGDAWVREMMAWHFGPETGCPFWLEWKDAAGWDPRDRVRTVGDLDLFGFFQADWLRYTPLEKWVPRAYRGKPYHVFETGGTTGMPKQRLNWNDYQTDYAAFSEKLDPQGFPFGAYWLHFGPTGPRRLRLAVEYLANIRGGACLHIDLDPRWVVRLKREGRHEVLDEYMDHLLEQVLVLLRHRPIRCLYATPRLLEALAERTSIPGAGVTGVFCGGTSMTPQVTRFLIEEVLEGRVVFEPTYGNVLMGVAHAKPLEPEDEWSVVYHAPQPRAVLRVVDPDDPTREVEYGAWGRILLTTMTREFFMPNMLERDEARRARPCAAYPWDGVRDVRPFQRMGERIVEGVY
jgi:phenylacetate-coenzyme A ligase PaaK-like adenylate-forming protein